MIVKMVVNHENEVSSGARPLLSRCLHGGRRMDLAHRNRLLLAVPLSANGGPLLLKTQGAPQ